MHHDHHARNGDGEDRTGPYARTCAGTRIRKMKNRSSEGDKLRADPVTDDDHWLVHEVHYWEGAFDRLRAQFLELQGAHDEWKQAHAKVIDKLHEWEGWHKSLTTDRDLIKQRYADKQLEVEDLLKQLDRWTNEHGKVVEQVGQ